MLHEFDDVKVYEEQNTGLDDPPIVPDVHVIYLASSGMSTAQLDADDTVVPTVLIVEGLLGELPPLATRPVAILPAEVDAETLHIAVIAAHSGLSAIDVTYAEIAGIDWKQPSAFITSGMDSLTVRELQVLDLVAQGLPNKSIAHALGISDHTVKFHVGSILAKLGAESRTEAVTLATRRGILAI
jgi:DNA-binding CsgD family transcriptional regulator